MRDVAAKSYSWTSSSSSRLFEDVRQSTREDREGNILQHLWKVCPNVVTIHILCIILCLDVASVRPRVHCVSLPFILVCPHVIRVGLRSVSARPIVVRVCPWSVSVCLNAD